MREEMVVGLSALAPVGRRAAAAAAGEDEGLRPGGRCLYKVL
jgi:hypothetical protein